MLCPEASTINENPSWSVRLLSTIRLVNHLLAPVTPMNHISAGYGWNKFRQGKAGAN